MDEQDLRNILDDKIKENPELKNVVFRYGLRFALRCIYFALFFFLLGFIIGKLM